MSFHKIIFLFCLIVYVDVTMQYFLHRWGKYEYVTQDKNDILA